LQGIPGLYDGRPEGIIEWVDMPRRVLESSRLMLAGTQAAQKKRQFERAGLKHMFKDNAALGC
jgi:hypothetical protein